MQNTLELGAYIIDLTEAMLEYGHQLHLTQKRQLVRINRQTVDFVTRYMRYERAPLPDLLQYLRQEALMPIQGIIASSELLLSGLYGPLPDAYREALNEIQGCGYDMQADIIGLQANLLQFMDTMELHSVANAG